MPAIKEIKRGREIGYRSGNQYQWLACVNCGKERWVELKKDKLPSPTCYSCCRILIAKANTGKNSYRWKGGRKRRTDGYIWVWLDADDFFYPMRACNHYVLEHRLVMARHLGRCLNPWEMVHHKNGNRGDNSIGNLALMTDAGHRQITRLEMVLKRQQANIEELKWKVKNLENILVLKEGLWDADLTKN